MDQILPITPPLSARNAVPQKVQKDWFGLENRDKIPIIAEGKYLKPLYDLHEKMGPLDIDRKNLKHFARKQEDSGPH